MDFKNLNLNDRLQTNLTFSCYWSYLSSSSKFVTMNFIERWVSKFRNQFEIPLKIELFESLFSTIEYLSLAISLHTDWITRDTPKHFCSKKELYSHNNVWALFQLCKRTRWIQIPIRSSVPFHWIERWSFQKNWRFCFAYQMLRVFSPWFCLVRFKLCSFIRTAM